MLQNASCASEWRKYLDIACCFSDFSDVCFAHIVSCFRRKARHFWSWHLLLSAVKSTERSLHGVLSAAIICPREFQYVRHCHGSGGLLPRKPGLDPRLVNVRFAVDKSSAGIFFFEYFCCFPVSIFTAVLDTEFQLHVDLTRRTGGRTDEGWEPSKKECFLEVGEYWIRST